MKEDFDTILAHVGTGKWNLFYYATLGYWFSCCAYQTLSSAFQTPNIAYTCILPNGTERYEEVSSPGSLWTSGNASVYVQETPGNLTSSCTYGVLNVTTGVEEEVKCVRWQYDQTPFVTTATAEYDLICDWDFLRATYQSVYMFGVFVGAGVNGFMADRFGRRKMIIIGTVCYTFLAMILVWLKNFTVILVVRFLTGTMHPTSLITGYVLIMEVTEQKRRASVGIFIFITWSIGTMLIGGWAYFIRDWRWLQLALSLPCFLFLPSLWFMDESPRWLVIEGRFDEALATLEKAARWNGANLPEKDRLLTIFKTVQKELGLKSEDESSRSLKMRLKEWCLEATKLFRTPTLRMVTLTMYVDFFVVAMVYFGLSLGGGSFKVNLFLYMVISGLVEVPSHTVVIPIVMKFGRKIPLIASYFITGVCMLVQPLISEEYSWLAITTVMIGKMTISTVFQIVGLFSTELFPTEVRNRGLGTSMMMSRVGAIIAPYLIDLIGVHYPWSPSVVFGVASLIAGLVSLTLRETSNSALPDTIADLEGYDNPTLNVDRES